MRIRCRNSLQGFVGRRKTIINLLKISAKSHWTWCFLFDENRDLRKICAVEDTSSESSQTKTHKHSCVVKRKTYEVKFPNKKNYWTLHIYNLSPNSSSIALVCDAMIRFQTMIIKKLEHKSSCWKYHLSMVSKKEIVCSIKNAQLHIPVSLLFGQARYKPPPAYQNHHSQKTSSQYSKKFMLWMYRKGNDQ